MKRIIVLLSCFFVFGCRLISGNGIEQEISVDKGEYRLCPSRHCFWTYVWVNREIVWSRYDDVNTLTDSIVIERQKQAQAIYNAIKKAK